MGEDEGAEDYGGGRDGDAGDYGGEHEGGSGRDKDVGG